jgi:hypothetical protein
MFLTIGVEGAEPPAKGAAGDTAAVRLLPVLEHAGRSEPLFLFFRNGHLKAKVLGANLPAIAANVAEFAPLNAGEDAPEVRPSGQRAGPRRVSRADRARCAARPSAALPMPAPARARALRTHHCILAPPPPPRMRHKRRTTRSGPAARTRLQRPPRRGRRARRPAAQGAAASLGALAGVKRGQPDPCSLTPADTQRRSFFNTQRDGRVMAGEVEGMGWV